MEREIFLSTNDLNCLIKFVSETSNVYNALKNPVDLMTKATRPPLILRSNAMPLTRAYFLLTHSFIARAPNVKFATLFGK
jgi:hypothetical protein